MRLDDDTYLDTSPSRSIGEIKLVIDRAIDITKLYQKKAKTRKQRTYLAPPQMVHEQCKKAIAHEVGYVPVTSLTLHNIVNT